MIAMVEPLCASAEILSAFFPNGKLPGFNQWFSNHFWGMGNHSFWKIFVQFFKIQPIGKCLTALKRNNGKQHIHGNGMSFHPKKARNQWVYAGLYSFIITMKYNRLLAGLPSCLLAGLVFLSLSSNVVWADTLRQQVVSLHKGWNAVFLQVDPTNASPADCFQGTPVTMVAQFIGNASGVQFVQNPSTNSINRQGGWLVWYAPSRPDSFLTQLFALSGNASYLIYSQSDFIWSATGNAVLTSVTWKPNSFSLVGFGLDDLSPPTFNQFFDGSTEHHPYRIYRLLNDNWTLVDQAAATQMRSGEAYWIYCKGSSDYQGPLYAKVSSGQSLILNGANPAGALLANKSKNPLSVRVENVSGSAQLPLGFVLRAVTETNIIATTFDLPSPYAMPSFDAGENRGFWLAARTEQMSASTQTGLLKITTDLGTQCWLPVTVNRSELPPQ